MDSKISEAAALLASAWQTGIRLDSLPPSVRPASLDESHAIQRATADRLGEKTVGWKAGIDRPIRAPVFASRLFKSPARIPARRMLRRMIEGEVAFVFDRDMPPASRDYTRNEVAACVSACVTIEVVDSRFKDQAVQPELDRIADLIGNSALVYSEPVTTWQNLALDKIHVTLTIDGKTIVDQPGGHGTGDPLHACVLFVNGLRTSTGVSKGQIATMGTYTGAPVMEIGSTAVVTFAGLGSAQVTFAPE
jgi:2-keto-4-pentenoate hydratase